LIREYNEIIPQKYKVQGYFWVPSLGINSPRYFNMLNALFDGVKYFYLMEEFRRWASLSYETLARAISVSLMIQDDQYVQLIKKPKH